jgi:geranylgeranyl pyrophosphate synthase
MKKYQAIEYATKVAKQFANKARTVLLNECDWIVEKKWKNFFLEQTNYLVQRKN